MRISDWSSDVCSSDLLDGDRMDASLLLMPCLGYGNPEDARMRTTFERIEARLGRDGLFYRYEPKFDAVAAPEGAFGICSFIPEERRVGNECVRTCISRFAP